MAELELSNFKEPGNDIDMNELYKKTQALQRHFVSLTVKDQFNKKGYFENQSILEIISERL